VAPPPTGRLVRGLLTRGRSPTAPGLFLGSRSSGVGDLAGSGGAGVIGWLPLSKPRGEVPERSNGAVSGAHIALPLSFFCFPLSLIGRHGPVDATSLGEIGGWYGATSCSGSPRITTGESGHLEVADAHPRGSDTGSAG
jgi:hypothetical protein